MNKYLSRTLKDACVYFTALSFLYAAVVYIQFGMTSDGGLVSSPRLVMMFFFALAFSASNALLRGDSSRVIKTIFHALITAAAFFLFMILPAGISGATAFAGMFIYFAAYALCALIYYLVLRGSASRAKKDSEYTSVFTKK